MREPKCEAFDLMSPIALYRLAKHFHNGAKKYSRRNWQKGIAWSTCINAIFRHTLKFMTYGNTDEDHLAAIMWNAMVLAEYETTHPEMNDLAWSELDKEMTEKIKKELI